MRVCFEMCYCKFESQKGDVMGEWKYGEAITLSDGVEVSTG